MDSEKFLVEALQELIELKDLIKSGNNLIIMRFVKRSTLQLSQIFLSQFEAGSNCLRIRFSNKDAYEQAKNWISDDPSELYDILSSIGYHGSFYRWNNDDLNTYTIGLYPPE